MAKNITSQIIIRNILSRSKGGSLNRDLHAAAAAGDAAAISSLIRQGAYKDIVLDDETGETPLHLASKNGHTDAVRALLAAGASIHAATSGKKDGRTPLHTAAHAGHLDIVILLLDSGIPANIPSIGENWGDTALHLACRHGHDGAAAELLARGANPAQQNHGWETPLHQAALGGHVATARLLLEAGADCNVRNMAGKTPLHSAATHMKEDGKTDIVTLLAGFGAKPLVHDNAEELPESCLDLKGIEAFRAAFDAGRASRIEGTIGADRPRPPRIAQRPPVPTL